jgi:hypothetical protein
VKESREDIAAALSFVMLEDGVQADDGQILLWKSGAELLELRKRVAHATGAEHLERERGNGPAAQG